MKSTIATRISYCCALVFTLVANAAVADGYLPAVINLLGDDSAPTSPLTCENRPQPSFSSTGLATLFPQSCVFTFEGAIRTPYGAYGFNTIEINKRYPNRLFLSGGGFNGDPGQTSIVELDISATKKSFDSLAELNVATITQAEVAMWAKIEANAQPNTDAYTVQPGGAPNGDHPIFADMFYQLGATESEDRLLFSYRVFYASPGDEGVIAIADKPNDLSNSTMTPLIRSELGAAVSNEIIAANDEWRTALGKPHLFIADHSVRLANGIQGGPQLATGDLDDLTVGEVLPQSSVMSFTLQNPIWQDPGYRTETIDYNGRDPTNFSGKNSRYTFMTGITGGVTIGSHLYVFGTSGGHQLNEDNPRRFLTQAEHVAQNGNEDGRTPNAFAPDIIGTIDYKAVNTLGYQTGGPNTYDAQDLYPWVMRFSLSDILNAQQPHDVRPDRYGRFEPPLSRYNAVDGYTVPGAIRDGISGLAVDPNRRRLYLALPWPEQSNDPEVGRPVIAVYSY